jgi:hypothetical protein
VRDPNVRPLEEGLLRDHHLDIFSYPRSSYSVLTNARHYDATGAPMEKILFRIPPDIHALSDILDIDSHRLNEPCKVFDALGRLFVNNCEKPSLVVVHAPSWLKHSSFSELLVCANSLDKRSWIDRISGSIYCGYHTFIRPRCPCRLGSGWSREAC